MKRVFVIGGSDQFKENIKKLSNEFVEIISIIEFKQAEEGCPILVVNNSPEISTDLFIKMIGQINQLEFIKFEEKCLKLNNTFQESNGLMSHLNPSRFGKGDRKKNKSNFKNRFK